MTTSLRDENRSSLPPAALAALVLGLVLCPSIYVVIEMAIMVAIGLRDFSPAFLFVALPLLLISSGYILFRFLGKPKARASSSVWLIAEILSWLVITVFLTVVSDYAWFTPFQQIGIFFVFFLVTSLFSLPVVLMRKTALQQRLMKLPNSVITPLLVWAVSVSATIAVINLLTPEPIW